MRDGDKREEQSKEKLQKLGKRIDELETVEAQRQQTKQTPLESTEGYRFLVDHSKEIILVLNKRGKIIFANKSTLTNFGYSKEELIGKSITHFLARGSIKKALYALAQEFLGRPQRELEVQATTRSGEIRYLSVAEGSAPIYENGKLIGVMISASDITERKQAEEILKKRSAQLELIHHIQSEIPMNTDIETILIRTAESIGKSFGYYKISVNLYDREKNEIEYLTGWNKTGLSLPRGHRQKLGQGLIGKAGLSKQTIVANDVSKEPDYIPYHLTETKAELIIPLLVQDKLVGVLDLQATRVNAFSKEDVAILGSVANYIAYIIDWRQREEALRESEEKFRSMSDSAQDAILMMDHQGNISYWNKAAEKILGYSAQETLGKELHTFLAPKHYQAAFKEAFSRFKKIGQGPAVGKTLELEAERKDGTEIPIELSISATKLKGEWNAIGILRDITERKHGEKELLQTSEKLRQALGSIINVVGATVELKDPYTAGHQKRVADLARSIATEMALSKDQIEGIRIAGIIHDIGKISVPAEILSRPGRLSENEFCLIKNHAQVGYEILKDIEFQWPIAQIVYQHHEKMDGSGYPQGLKGEDIILEARILAVADAVEAMASHRPYRPALGIDKALEEISQKKGILYDPDVVHVCVKLFSENKFKFE